MSKPTCRELLDSLHARCPVAGCPACELNARVEAVLQMQPRQEADYADREWNDCLAEVLRRLAGGRE